MPPPRKTPEAPSGPQFFAPCPRGLEAALADELAALGLPDVTAGNAGVAFGGDWAGCYRANLESRIASRILWRVSHGRYRNEDDVYRAAHALPWHDWFGVDDTIRVDVTAIASPLKSLEFITLRIKDAVCDRFRARCGRRPSVDTARPDVRIQAFLTAAEVTLYLDTSGEPLFKRGWRRHAVEAPLRENLAAGILRLTGWTAEEPLFDPMCGSGTFLVEAAQLARAVAPGLGRGFGFEKLAFHDAALWARVRTEAQARVPAPARPIVFGADLDAKALSVTRSNLRDAGVADAVRLEQADVLDVRPPADGGVAVMNPPYGVRIGDAEQLAGFYPRLGDALKQRFAGWRVFVFSADLRLPKLIGLRAQRRTPLFNGALECRLYEYRMIAGTLRHRAAEPA
jgi:putative N6-adenine-specific DNA methylase